MQPVTALKQLPLSRMLAFGVGDIFGGGSFNIINFLYPGYVALAVGLPAQTAGLIIMIARMFDAMTDPLMGYFSDRLRVRYGTRRGSMLVAAPLIVLALFLMFYPHSNPSEAVRFWLVLISYIFFYVVQTSVMIPYFSLSSEMTEDYTERARMTTLRLGFSIFASIVCVAVPGMIVAGFEGNDGYMAMSLIFGSVFMICVGITGFFAKEGIAAPKKTDTFVLKDFAKPFRIKQFRQYLGLFLCCQLTMAIMSALFFFYVDFYFCSEATARGEGNTVGLLGAAIMFSMQIVALPVYMAMVRKAGKMAVYILGASIWIAGALVLLALPANSAPVLLYMLAAVIGFGISGPGLIPHAIFGDVVDVGNLHFGARTAGMFSGIANLTNKLAAALGLAAVMTIIGMAGFIEQDIREGAEKVTAQPESAQAAIVMLMALAPLAFMSVGIFICTQYSLGKEQHAQVLSALEGGEREKAAVLKALSEGIQAGVRRPNPFLYGIIYMLFYPSLKLLFRLEVDRSRYRPPQGPFLVVSNHVSFMDFLLVMLALYPCRLNAVAAQKFFFYRPLDKLLPMMGCVPKNLFDPDIRSIKGIKAVIRRGGKILLFPEGRCAVAGTYMGIHKATGKLVKNLGVPVISCHIEGAGTCMPLWRKGLRLGRERVTIAGLFSAEDTQTLSVDEINGAIDARLSGLDTPPPAKPFRVLKAKRLTEGLENLLYYCPKCGRELTLETGGNTIRCRACGNMAKMDKAAKLTPAPGSVAPESVQDWYREQARYETSFLSEDMEPIGIEVTLRMKAGAGDGLKPCGNGVLRLEPDGWYYDGDLSGDAVNLFFPLHTVPAIPFDPGDNIQIYAQGNFYAFSPEDGRLCSKFATLGECAYWRFTSNVQMTPGCLVQK